MGNFVPPLPGRPHQRWSRLRLATAIVLALLAYGAFHLLYTPSDAPDTPSAWVRWLAAALLVGFAGLCIEGGWDYVLWNREIPAFEAQRGRWMRVLRMSGAVIGLGLLGLLALWFAGKLL